MAYLRLVANDADDLAFERIINVPKRGLGAKSILEIETNARKNNISLLESCYNLSESNHFNVKTSANLRNFLNYLKTWKAKSKELSTTNLVEIQRSQVMLRCGKMISLEAEGS